MLQRHPLQRALWLTASVVATALLPARATARNAASHACAAALGGAQERQRSGHLREARDLLLRCAKPACGVVQKRCASAAEQLASDIALVQPIVTDGAGNPLLDVRVKVDDQPVASRLDGRALPVDPGVHEFAFSARLGPWPGREVSVTRTITIEQGQRGPIAVTLGLPVEDEANDDPDAAPLAQRSDTGHAADEPTPEHPAPERRASEGSDAATPEAPRARGGRSALPYLLGGVGLAGVGAGALLTYWGKTDNGALAQCTPNCEPSSVAHIRQLYLAADLSIGGGAAALAVSALFFATSRSSDAAAIAPAKASALQLDVRPTRSGAMATIQGSF